MCLSVCHFALVFFSPFSVAIISLGEERAGLGAFFYVCSVCACLDLSVSSSSLGLWGARGEGLRFVVVALPGLFSYLFCIQNSVNM